MAEYQPGRGKPRDIDLDQYHPTTDDELFWIELKDFPVPTLKDIPEGKILLWKWFLNPSKTLMVVNVLHIDLPKGPFQIQIVFDNGIKDYFMIRLSGGKKGEKMPFELIQRITDTTILPDLIQNNTELFKKTV